MLNLIVALRLWGADLANTGVVIHCDNWAVVQVVRSGGGRDPFFNLRLRNLWLITASHDIELNMQHISSHTNVIADALSRIYSTRTNHQDCLMHLNQHAHWDAVSPSVSTQYVYLILGPTPGAALRRHTDPLPTQHTKLTSEHMCPDSEDTKISKFNDSLDRVAFEAELLHGFH